MGKKTHIVILMIILAIFANQRLAFSINSDSSKNEDLLNSYVVSKKGDGDYKTIQEAIDASPSSSGKWTKILIKNGTYEELVNIPKNKSRLILRGEDREKTIITSSSYQKAEAINKSYNLSDYTITNHATDVIISNLTVNNRTWKVNPTAKANWDIAIQNRGDKFIVHHVTLLGRHNTFDSRAYSGSRFYMTGCHIKGQSHFVAIFDNDGVIENTTFSYANITGGDYAVGIFKRGKPQQEFSKRTALVIRNCKFTGSKIDSIPAKVSINDFCKGAVVYFIGNTFDTNIEWLPFVKITEPSVNGTAWIFRYQNTGIKSWGGENMSNPEGGPMLKELTKDGSSKLGVTEQLSGQDNWNPISLIKKFL